MGFENATGYPAPGEISVLPGWLQRDRNSFPVRRNRFASKMGQLAGNHFLTITQGREHFAGIGDLVLHHGAQDILFQLKQGQ